MSRLTAALVSGIIAIGINTALLVGSDALGFITARGGLLRFVRDIAANVLPLAGLAGVWRDTLAPVTAGTAFQIWFHIFVGLTMALFYAYVLESSLRGSALRKGMLYAAFAWLLNAFVVLPLTGEGIAGSNRLGLANILGFAVIHTVFFVLLAMLYGGLHGLDERATRRRRRQPANSVGAMRG